MNHRFRIFVLMLFFLFSAYGGGSASSRAAEAVASPTQTSVPERIMPVAQPTSTPDPTSACKLKLPPAVTDVGLGFPKLSHRMDSVGGVRTVVLFADFSDAAGVQTPERGSQTPQEAFALISPEAQIFFSDMSYHRVTWKLVPHFTWLRLSHPSAHYAGLIRTSQGHQEFIQEAVKLADAQNVDFSDADSVVVMIPSRATAVPNGPAFTANADQGYTADGKTFSNGLTSGADLQDEWAMRGVSFRWLNHEAGHTMGLPDLYAFQGDTHRFVGGFGLMGRIDANAPEYFAFERWQLGWLDDSQIVCLPSGERRVFLSAIEITLGIKAVIVPLSESRAVVVESRQPFGHDLNLVKPGALVYMVDTSVRTGEGPLVIQNVLENDPNRDRSPLGYEESITVEGVTITGLGYPSPSNRLGDEVRVKVTK